MKLPTKFVVIFFIIQIFFTPLRMVQSQTISSSLSGLDGLGNQFFNDQIGLQLIQTATPLDNFINDETYLLGPYDILSIQGKGLVEFSYRAIVVNASGNINAPIIGSVSLRGKSLKEAKEFIIEAFNNEVNETEITVTLDQPRPVNVYVGGNIPNPGRYILPAGTRFDALITGFPVDNRIVTPLVNQETTSKETTAQPTSYSGINFEKVGAQQQSTAEVQNVTLSSISKKFDLRYVKVNSLNGNEYYVDLAGYFNSGNPKFAPFVMDGDRITLINASETRPTVSISGAVNNPFSGSYREDDTFDKLLTIAGGYSPEADISEVIVIRIKDEVVTQLSIPPNELSEVQPGDQIIIKYQEKATNFGSVRIEGEVELPGIYSIVENKTTLGELLEMAGGLTDNALPNAAYLIRNSYDNRGVKSISEINLSLLGRSSDQVLEGYEYLEFEQALDPNRMAVHLNKQQVLKNTIMQNGDRLFIPRDENTISVLGQVNVPGFYTFKKINSIDNYLSAANGLTIAANPERIFIIKAGSRAWYPASITQLESGDIIFVDRIPFENLNTSRTFDLEIQKQKSERVRLFMSTIGTITSIITTYIAVQNLN